MQFMSYMIQYYYHTLSSNRFDTPNFTDLMRICESIINKDPKGNEAFIKELKEINDRVGEIDINLAQMELVFYKNAHKGINAEIDIKGDSYTLGHLFSEVNKSISKMTKIVSEIAYKYDIDIPLNKSKRDGGGW